MKYFLYVTITFCLWSDTATASRLALAVGLAPSDFQISKFNTGSRQSNEAYEVLVGVNDEDSNMPFVGLRLAQTDELSGSFYRAVLAGVRYFPASVSGPIVIEKGRYDLSYEDRFRPYLEAGGGWGRYVFAALDDFGSQKIESEFIEGGGGVGLAVAVGRRFSMDIGTSYGIFRGTDRIDFEGTRLTYRIGMQYFY